MFALIGRKIPEIVRGRILATAIRMMQHGSFRPLMAIRLIQRPQAELPGHSLAHVKPDDLTCAQVFQTGEIEPSFVSRNIRDVRHPDLEETIDDQ